MPVCIMPYSHTNMQLFLTIYSTHEPNPPFTIDVCVQPVRSQYARSCVVLC